VIPPSTLRIENPAAIVDANVDRHGNREVVEAFVQFLWSDEAQGYFADYGFRPVAPAWPRGSRGASGAGGPVHDGRPRRLEGDPREASTRPTASGRR